MMYHGRLFAAICVVWVVSELVLAFGKRAEGTRRDRGSLSVLWIAISLATVAGGMLRGVRATRIAAPHTVFWIGIALILGGIVFRAIAIAFLWKHFSVAVVVSEQQELIQRGPYRFLRHPAYTGSLLSFLGLGLAFGNWISVAVIAVVTIAAMAYRIHVEEQALTERFGDAYRAYASRTKRLIPGLY